MRKLAVVLVLAAGVTASASAQAAREAAVARMMPAVVAAAPGTVAPVPAAVRPVAAPPSWQTWWKRNRNLVAAPQRTTGLVVGTHFLVKPVLSGTAEQWLAMTPAAFAKRCSDEVAHGATASHLLDLARLPGQHGEAAIVALGLTDQPSVVALLESVLHDDCVGRSVARESPVSHGKRIAAALGLGLVSDATATGALRGALTDGTAREDAVDAALLLSLGLGAQERDADLFHHYLREGRGGTAAREAAAVGMGRLIGALRDGRHTFAALLETDPTGAGRGVAGSAWLIEPEPNDPLGPALSAAAQHGEDPTTRLMSVLSLAGRGDERCIEVVTRMLDGEGSNHSYALLALGLYARAESRARPHALRLIRRFEFEAPEVAEVATELAQAGGVRDAAPRRPAMLTGGNGGFVEAATLQGVIDLIAH